MTAALQCRDMVDLQMGDARGGLNRDCQKQPERRETACPEIDAAGIAPGEYPTDQADAGSVLEFLVELLSSLG